MVTSVSQNIHDSYYSMDYPSYDECCKKILCNKQMARIIKECVSEFHDIPLPEIPDYIDCILR